LVLFQQRNNTGGKVSFRTIPESEVVGSGNLLQLRYLNRDVEAARAVGFDPDISKQLGIGYAPRGNIRRTVPVPNTDGHGPLQGEFGFAEAKLPSDSNNTVVEFHEAWVTTPPG